MQHDDVIWQVINNKFCSYKVKSTDQNFCRNQYNVTGLCNRQSCPLANSNYATIREIDGVAYLYVKTIERSHTPAKMWERTKLSKNYETALKQIDSILEHWPNFTIHKAKQRLTKITQYLIKTRRMLLKAEKGLGLPKLLSANKKISRRELGRERKAEVAARLEQSIEKELLLRLQNGTYGELPYLPQKSFDKVLNDFGEEDEEDEEVDEDHEIISEFVEGITESENEIEDATNDFSAYNNYEFEYENEDENFNLAQ